MDSNNLKHRTTTDPSSDPINTSATTDGGDVNRAKRQGRIASAKRGLRSLTIAVLLPVLLTLSNIYFFGGGPGRGPSRLNWIPPHWALHMTCLASVSLLGLSAWIVWADGGFHRDPSAVGLYLGLLGLGLAWDPIVFRFGLNWAGLAVAAAVGGGLWRWSRVARRVNPMAGDLVMPCLGWAGFLACVNLKMMFASDHHQSS
ncbi:hypothetical protein Droror1_Dr00026238 [Drosera rotundifolia]